MTKVKRLCTQLLLGLRPLWFTGWRAHTYAHIYVYTTFSFSKRIFFFASGVVRLNVNEIWYRVVYFNPNYI